jgi:putative oxidoreductase
MSAITVQNITELKDKATAFLSRYSIDIMRVSLGLVFICFGVLKFIPGASPAAALAVETIEKLTFGFVSGDAALLLTATMETFIGLTLVSGKLLKTGLAVLAVALVGIMSPLVISFGELFPTGTPTLAAQYVFKDIVLAAAGLVIGAKALGARFVSSPAKAA